MPGYFRLEVPRRSDRNGGKRAKEDPSALLLCGARLWCDEHPLEIGGDGYLIGHLFKRGATSRVLDLCEAAAEKILASGGRSLASDYWGGYVAILARPDGHIAVFRDPSGLLPVYYREDDRCLTLSSDAAELGKHGGVNYPAMLRFLASAGAPSRETCLEDVRLLLPGEGLIVAGGSHQLESWWSPWDWTQVRHRSYAAAAKELRAVALDCIGSWTSCFDSILVGVSGGLDSSIVACAAARRAAALHCLTMVEDDAIGDERRYASILTTALGTPLLEANYDLGAVDIGRAVAPHHPWPHAPFYMQAIEAVHDGLRREQKIDAFFSGNGGDNIFCSIRSATPFVDRFMAQGPRHGLFDTLRDLSDLTGASGTTILRHAWDRYRDVARPPSLHRDYSGLSSAAIAELEHPRPSHPWMQAPEGGLPGKAAHVRLLARAQRSIELYPRRTHPRHIPPLLSQPIVETCLSIPTWQWVAGGRDRSVARAAFKSVVPAELLRRTSKGGPGGFMHRIYQANAERAGDLLRNGLLARAGLLDLSILEAASRPTAQGFEKAQRVLELCAAESWARWWSDVARS
ncbi:MAG: asparagine synthase-related protein [Sphingopyxis sp.]|uniref:asparagine synthase-related protein n=1 Tax=Sphingopyxis sp. TaxID=1908224 RepID=UPI003D6DA028